MNHEHPIQAPLASNYADALLERAQRDIDRADTLDLLERQVAILEDGLARVTETVALSVASLALIGRVIREMKAKEEVLP
jgi:hypothetical protein